MSRANKREPAKLTRAELMHRLACDGPSIERLIDHGLPHFTDGRFPEAEIMRWLAANKRMILPLLRMTRAA